MVSFKFCEFLLVQETWQQKPIVLSRGFSFILRICLLTAVALLLVENSYATESAIFVDRVLVKKFERKLYLIKDGKPIREYHVALGDDPVGPKRQQGDEKTPEGHYVIDYRNPHSAYHLSLHINYPSKKDQQAAKKRGVNPGGDIFIHGAPNGMGLLGSVLKNRDWTDGCIAVSNSEIEEMWELVRNGTPIDILP